MASNNGLKSSMKNRVQHYLLNWIVISRYHMVHRGIPKTITLRYLAFLENFLRKINIIT